DDRGDCWDTTSPKGGVPMIKKYIVRLSDDERAACQDIIKALKGSSQRFRRAQILLKADADGPGWPDVKIAEAFNCRVQTIENLRRRLVAEGFERALDGKKRQEPPTPASSMARPRRSSSPCGWGHRRPATDTGPC